MNDFASYDPVTGKEAGRYPVATFEEVYAAVQSLRPRSGSAENGGWRELSVQKRAVELRKLGDRIAEEADGLAEIVSCEIGKPLQEAYGADILPAIDAIKWICKAAPGHLGKRNIFKNATLSPEPYGVVGVIGTWNYPIFLNIVPIVWALMAGASVVWKPSELATATALRLKTLFDELRLPVSVVTGEGTTGQALCRAGCDKIVFTGGVATGRAILRTLAESGTPAVMELSGNDAMIVCKDANVSLAARSAVWGRCSNAGQSCVAPQRVYVARSVLEAFLNECKARMLLLRKGEDFGPMRTTELRTRAENLVCQTIDEGGRLIFGGVSNKAEPGFYMPPTLMEVRTSAASVMKEDFFGPFLAVQGFDSLEEGIRLANDSEMGLGASVWTENAETGMKIASALKAGLVSVNQILLDAANPALPFGGAGASGFGKQRGIAGLDEFVHWKATVLHSSRGERRHLFPYQPGTNEILKSLVTLKSGLSIRAKREALRELAKAIKNWGRK